MGKYADDFFEPWTPMRSRVSCSKPDFSKLPEDVRCQLEQTWERADDQADWHVWGRRMCEPGWVRSLMGEWVYDNDMRIVTISRWLGLPEGSPDQEAVCRRICLCVNALAGVKDPAAGLAAVHDVLLRLQKCETMEELEALKLDALRAWGKISPRQPKPEPTW
jgi:hypothetical protein